MTDKSPKRSDDESLLPDTALSNPSLDRLDRAPFAHSLSKSILNLDGEDSFVVGLCGPWGSGKTSVLNFVVSDLEACGDDAPIILRFNPWWFSGRDQLLETFLAQFRAVMRAPKRGDKAKMAAKLFSTLSAGLRPLSLIPIIGEAAKAAREATEAVAGASKAYAEAVQQNVIEIRKQIDVLLKDFAQRIVVVMDDIDRLAADEIAQLFLILKAVADFPRTVYLLAFDHQIVAQAIYNKLGVDGKAYLEKIVQLQIDVPPTAHVSIHQMFVEQLAELLREEVFDQAASQVFWNVFHDGIKHFLVTPRAVKKLINMLRFAYPPLRGEVNAVDMIATSCLTTFVPHVIPIIATNADYFVGSGSSGELGGRDERKEAESFHRGWLAQVSDADREAVEGIVRRLFPSVNYALGGPGYSAGFDTQWRAGLRVCSSVHFEKYFRLAIPHGTISENEWTHLVSRLKDGNLFDQEVLSLADSKGPHGAHSRASEFLDRALHHAKLTSDPSLIEQMFLALMRVSDRLCAVHDETALGGMFPLDNTRRLNWVLNQLLERLETEKERQGLITKAIQQEKTGLFVATELVVSLGFQNGLYGAKSESDGDPRYKPIVSKRFVSQKAREVSRIVEAAGQAANPLAQHSMFMKIIINWWRIGGRASARKWLLATVSDDRLLIKALMQQVSMIRSHGMSDRVAKETPTIDSGFLSSFLNLKKLRVRCVQLLADKPEWLDEKSSATLQVTIGAITPGGKPISHREKR